jgi:hypothetical protein
MKSPTELIPVARSVASPAAVVRKRKAIALGVAALSDLVQVALLPLFVEGVTSPFDIALDAATALAILLVVGFRWRLVLALALELVPGGDLFPSWTAMVLSLPTLPPALPGAEPAHEGRTTQKPDRPAS